MAIVRWEPFREIMSLRQAMDRLFEESFIRPTRFFLGEDGAIPLDVYETPDQVVVKASLPGVKPGEMDITLTGDTLTIKGETKGEREVKRDDYLLQEHRYGKFARSVSLPEGLQGEKAEATFESGILTLTIPKAEEVKPKTIRVKAVAEEKAEAK